MFSEEQNTCHEHGFITAELIRKYCGDAPFSVFLCGPAAMYAFEEKELATLVLERKSIRRELMAAPASPAALEGYPGDANQIYALTVKRFGQTDTMPMRAAETVLVALSLLAIRERARRLRAANMFPFSWASARAWTSCLPVRSAARSYRF